MSAVGLAATTSIAGIFGMNLVSGIEESPTAFVVVTAGSALVGAGVVAGLHAVMRQAAEIEERAKLAADDRLALVALLENMSSVESFFDRAQAQDVLITRTALADTCVVSTSGSGPPRFATCSSRGFWFTHTGGHARGRIGPRAVAAGGGYPL